MSVFNRADWLRQPNLLVSPNYSSPLANGLLALVNPNSGFNAVDGGQLTLAGTSVARAVANPYNSFQFNNSALSAVKFANNPFAGPTFSAFALVNLSALPTNTACIIWTRPQTTANAGLSLGVFNNSGTGQVQLWKIGTSVITRVGTITTGKTYAIGLSYSTGAYNLYINGIAVGNGSGLAYTADSVGVIGGQNNDTTNNWRGDIFEVAAWNRYLSAEEHGALAQNPWQLFEPQAPKIYSFSTGGASVSPTVTSVAGTGAAGSVAVEVDASVSGVSATGSPGALIGSVAAVIAGAEAAGQAGAVTGAGTAAPGGVAATGSAGLVTAAVSVPASGVQASGVAGIVSFAGGVNVPANGVAATGTAGSVAVEVDAGASGVSATGQPGSVTPAMSVTAAGVSASGTAGTVVAGAVNAISAVGVSATGQVNAVAGNVFALLAGVQASGLTGAVSIGGSVSVPGLVNLADVPFCRIALADFALGSVAVNDTARYAILLMDRG